jgi:hypothetical protein
LVNSKEGVSSARLPLLANELSSVVTAVRIALPRAILIISSSSIIIVVIIIIPVMPSAVIVMPIPVRIVRSIGLAGVSAIVSPIFTVAVAIGRVGIATGLSKG